MLFQQGENLAPNAIMYYLLFPAIALCIVSCTDLKNFYMERMGYNQPVCHINVDTREAINLVDGCRMEGTLIRTPTEYETKEQLGN